MAMFCLAGWPGFTHSGEKLPDVRGIGPLSQGPFGIRGIETNSFAEFF